MKGTTTRNNKHSANAVKRFRPATAVSVICYIALVVLLVIGGLVRPTWLTDGLAAGWFAATIAGILFGIHLSRPEKDSLWVHRLVNGGFGLLLIMCAITYLCASDTVGEDKIGKIRGAAIMLFLIGLVLCAATLLSFRRTDSQSRQWFEGITFAPILTMTVVALATIAHATIPSSVDDLLIGILLIDVSKETWALWQRDGSAE